MEYYDLHQRTMLADWANNLTPTSFSWAGSEELVCPIDSKVGSGSAGNTLIALTPISGYCIRAARFGNWETIVNVRTGEDATVTPSEPTSLPRQAPHGFTTHPVILLPHPRYMGQHRLCKNVLNQQRPNFRDGKARICFDNIRLLKTLPCRQNLNQVATCDAIELWTSGTGTVPTIGELVKDDYSELLKGFL